jgi:hypothetical protein
MSRRPLRASLAIQLLALGFGVSLGGCSQAQRDEPPVDCSIMDDVELLPVSGFAPSRWYPVPDHTIQQGSDRSVVTVAALVPTDTDPLPCGLTEGIEFKSLMNHDWGSFVGVYHDEPDETGIVPPLPGGDATGFEGLSFWAKSRYDKGLTLELTDKLSDEEAGLCEPATYFVNDAGMISDFGTPVQNPDFDDENGLPVANACGNNFSALLLPTERWAFYTIPFKRFRQTRQDASLKPGGIDLANIWRLLIRAPRGAVVEASFLNLAWYREKPQ